MELIKSQVWCETILKSGSKVLLINPPVQEIRYAWSKWNQPSELLALSGFLKKRLNCEVELLDFMLPNENNSVSTRNLSLKRKIGVGDFQETYTLRHFGRMYQEISPLLSELKQTWEPDHIVISSLTSYWYESIIRLIPLIKTILPRTIITVTGAYPVCEPAHAEKTMADYGFCDFLDLSNYTPDFKIYYQDITKFLNQGYTLHFGGLKYTNGDTVNNLIEQVITLNENGVNEFVIFEQDIFKDDILEGFLGQVEKKNMRPKFYGLCGIHLENAKNGIFTKMLEGGYRSLFIEHQTDNNGELVLDLYQRAYIEILNGPRVISSGNLAGFIMIGTSQDNLETMFRHAFNLLELFGTFIPKPFTPNLWSSEYEEVKRKAGLEYLSPHLFPLAEISNITRKEYRSFYQHAAFLNEKRAGKGFNFFDDNYSTEALKNSLRKKLL